LTSFAVDREFLTQTLVDMVRIDSRNPSVAPDGPGEAEIGAYVADTLSSLGLEVKVHEVEPGRVNVVGILRGSGGGRSLMLNGHLDTVGVEGMIDPFCAAIRDGRLYGRGSQDMKGSLAAMIAAVKALVDARTALAGDVLIATVADEEYMSIGTADLVEQTTADAAIVTEPTDMALCRAHRGYIWYEVETIGHAAHGSRFEEGIDANMRMGRFLAMLDHLERELRQRPQHPLTGPPSLHAAMIKGGTDISTYAAHCNLKIERRYIPGESEKQATQELQEIIDALAEQDPTFKATVEPYVERPPFEIGEDADIVRVVDACLASRLGEPPAHIGAPFWTDAATLAAAGIDTLLLGPVGHGLHGAEEWVDLASLDDLAHVLADTCVQFCHAST
jgi:acetylornithine deacetylase